MAYFLVEVWRGVVYKKAQELWFPHCFLHEVGKKKSVQGFLVKWAETRK